MAQADDCANAAFRTGVAAALADCRAYEQVSPTDKNGYDVGTNGVLGVLSSKAAADGDRLFYEGNGAFGNQSRFYTDALGYIATRGPSGWASDGVHDHPIQEVNFDTARITYRSDDLSEISQRTGGYTWFRNTLDGSRQLVTDPELGHPLWQAAITPDMRHMLVSVNNRQVLLIDRDPFGGVQRRVISLDPASGLPLPWGSPAGMGSDGLPPQQISGDGDRVVYFSNEGRPPGPDMFVGPNAPTLHLFDRTGSEPVSKIVSEPEDGVTVAPEDQREDQYWGGASDLSRLFFTTQDRLTVDGTGDAVQDHDSWGDLYAYETATGDLRDLSIDLDNPEGGQVLGVAGTSVEGDVAYFAALGQLGTGEGVQGQPNLFRWEEGPGNGSLTYVTTLAPFAATGLSDPVTGDARNVVISADHRRAVVSDSGRYLVFTSTARHTEYDNGGVQEIYVYDGDSDEVRCASCDDDGDPNRLAQLEDTTIESSISVRSSRPRNLTANGRLYFETRESLVTRDGNDRMDVYEYDLANGTVSLVSSGASPSPTRFLDSDALGDNVFFATREQLVGQDIDHLEDVYVARVGGGLESQQVSLPPPPCTGDSCQGAEPPRPAARRPQTDVLLGANGSNGPVRRCGRLDRRAGVLVKRARGLRRAARGARGARARRLVVRANRTTKRARAVQRKAVTCKRQAAR